MTQYNLGRALRKTRDLDAATQALRNAVELRPDWAVAHYELALLYIQIGELEMAREEYTILTTLDQKLADELLTRIYE